MILERFESSDQHFLFKAVVASWRGTCRRRRVGCVLVDDERHDQGTGYNGVPRDQPHCLDNPCPGSTAESGAYLDECYATHAEVNAYLHCNKAYAGRLTLYCTVMPCRSCAKMISNTQTRRLVVIEPYVDEVAVDIMRRAGVQVEVQALDWAQVSKFVEESRKQ